MTIWISLSLHRCQGTLPVGSERNNLDLIDFLLMFGVICDQRTGRSHGKPDEDSIIVRDRIVLGDFKRLYGGGVNGWHIHETLKLNYICVHGMIKLVLFDVRPDSTTKGNLMEIFFGDDNYCMVHIPCGIANASKGMTYPFAISCNVASEAHNPNLKYKRIDPHSGEIPYDWARKDF